MANATHKFTFKFEATTDVSATSGSNFGWSESWYSEASTGIDGAISRAKRLRDARRKLLTPGWTITGVRISNLDAAFNLTRKGDLEQYEPADGKGRYQGASVDEQAYDCLNISLSTQEGYHRTFQMRGIGNDVVNAGGRFLNPPQFETAFTNFKKELLDKDPQSWGGETNGEWDLKVRHKRGDAKVVRVVIDPAVIPGANPENPVVELDGNVNFAALQSVVLSDIKGMTHINGTWIIKVLTAVGAGPANLLVLYPKRRTTVTGVYTASGRAVSYAYTLEELNQATAGRGSTRRTGRPSDGPRGRRSNRR